MTPDELARLIRGLVGQELSLEQAQELGRVTVPATARPDTLVLREGEGADGLYIMLAGKAEVLKTRPDGQQQRIATVEAPTLLGEMSLVTDRPHSATVRAVTACEFAILTRPQFNRLIEAERIAAYKLVLAISQVLARRLYRMDDKVVELVASHGDTSATVSEIAALKHRLFSEWTF